MPVMSGLFSNAGARFLDGPVSLPNISSLPPVGRLRPISGQRGRFGIRKIWAIGEGIDLKATHLHIPILRLDER